MADGKEIKSIRIHLIARTTHTGLIEHSENVQIKLTTLVYGQSLLLNISYK